MSRIDLNVVGTGDFRQLETQLARLKAQIASLTSSATGLSVMGPQGMANMKSSLNLFEQTLKTSGQFQTQIVNLRSESEKFGSSLQKGNLKLGESFRVASAHIKGQQSAITRLAREQVKLMNSTTLALGDGRSMVITPRGIDEAIDKQKILNQEYRIFRQVVSNGSTQLINWGKNTQWAGRQLTVGLTVPLTIFGATAAKVFMDADQQLTRLQKVYGDASKGMVNTSELQAIRQETLKLAQEIASSMGVAVQDTLGIAADLAATGKEGNELLEATSEAMRLSVLGEVDRQEAMRATLSIQSVFNQDTKELAESINFLNAVENQTSTTLNDLVTGIVKAGPVVEGLGGSIEDLALMMVAMREGGIPASEAANAIKSSLASLINPTKQTTEVLSNFGINLIEIVDKNAGNVTGTLLDLQAELENLDDLSRQRAIEQIFGKFQFSRINALLSNLNKVGSQTEQVLKISGMSVQQLAATAEQELETLTESASMRFTRALEGLKANLIPIGEVFTEVGTMLLNVANKVLEVFNSLPEPIKNFINGLMLATAVIGPMVMIAGVLGNFFGYLIKGVSAFLAIKRAGRGVFEHFTPETIAARQASELLETAIYDEAKAINILNGALEKLNQTLSRMSGAATVAGDSMQGMARDTLAGAEAANAVATGTIPIRRDAGKSFTYSGPELSHLVPESTLKRIFDPRQLQYLMTPGTLLGEGDLAESKFQQLMGSRFGESGYYNPETMGSRSQALLSMSGGDPNSRLGQLIGRMSEQGMQRLYPTMQEHTAQIAKYQIAIESLFSKDSNEIKRVSSGIQQAIASGDLSGAAQILRQSINMSDEQLEALVANRAQEYRDEFNRIYQQAMSEGIDPNEAWAMASSEMQIAATTRESETYVQAGDKLSGTGFARTGGDPRRGSGLAIAALSGELPMSGELTAATQRRIEAMDLAADADRRIAASADKLTKTTQDELIQKNKDIANMKVRAGYTLKSGAVERNYALIGNKWYQVKKNQIRLLDTSNAQDQKTIQLLNERNIAESDKARSSRMAAQADKEEALQSKNAAKADAEEAIASKNAARADSAEATGGGGGLMGRMKGGMGKVGIGGLGMFASTAAMMIPQEDPNSALSQGADILGSVGMGASIGQFLGPKGAAIGAVIGLAAGVFTAISGSAERAAAELEALRIASIAASGSLAELEEEFLGTNIKDLSDIPLQAFGEKTEEAQSKLDQFTEALVAATEAEEFSVEKDRVKQISEMTSPSEFVNSAMLQGMIFEAIVGGASKEDIGLMLEGYLDVADKEYFADAVKGYLDKTIPDDASASKVASEYINGLIKSANSAAAALPAGSSFIEQQRDYDIMRGGRQIKYGGREADFFGVMSGLQQGLASQPQSQELLAGYLQSYTQGDMDAETVAIALKGLQDSSPGYGSQELYTVISGLQVNGQSILEADPEFLVQILQTLQEIGYETDDISSLADEVNRFSEDTELAAKSLNTLLANSDLKTFDEQLANIDFENLDPTVTTELEASLRNMGENGPAVADFFNGIISSGVDMENALKAVRLVLSGAITDLEQFKGLSAEEIIARITAQYNVEVNVRSGGGTYTPSGVTNMEMPETSSLISGAREALSGGSGGGGGGDTEEFDKRIEQQNKIIEQIKEERAERQKLLSLQEQSLNFALKEQGLKSQIARARAEGNFAEAALLQAQLDNEKAIAESQEKERRIQEKEDKRIEKAEEEKKKIEEEKKAASGGGGGGGGPSEEEMKKIEQRITYLQGQLGQSLREFGKDIEGEVLTRGLGGFFDSKPVRDFRKEMEELGIPVEIVSEYLDEVFDGFIKSSGLEARPEFKRVREALEDIGLEGENLEDVLPNAFAIIQDLRLTKTDKIDAIAKAFEDAGMDADEAKEKAKLFYKETSKDVVPTAARNIAAAWIRAGDSAARAAALSALAADVAAGNVSADAAEQRLADINLRYPLAEGGYVSGPGGPTSDLIPAMLSNGEYVIKASSVKRYGVPVLNAINQGVLPMSAMMGMSSKYPEDISKMSMGGMVGYNRGGYVSSSSSEYNITVNVSKTDASADEIAGEVVKVLKRRDRMNGAVTRI